MSGTFDKIVFGLAAVAFLPAVLAGGGFIIAFVLAVSVVVGAYGGREGLDLLKKQHIGSKAGARRRDVQDAISGDSTDDTWGRE
ncbi:MULTISPECIES: hypothetical protein [Halorussus]|uniref:hypothetical protein n=1 Tax=Halorussus TaxID=1070314 RepID=UPI00209CF89C|nr:hypothetical protein [Halorussus vallis]USZ78638.1 hypothetical protein NGM07_25145 [Halorussus vallis]USZ78669.1 hypothetical protein NGM07_24475 [Halorussus vallis]